MISRIAASRFIYKALLDTNRPAKCLALNSLSSRSYATDEQFQKAVQNSTKLKSDPDNDVKLELYALYKQATEGKNQKPKPSAMDFVGKYKWQAWYKLGNYCLQDRDLII